MAATVEELRRRVTAIAEESADTPEDRVGGAVPRRSGTVSVSTELFEVERALQQAARRLGNLTDALRGHTG